ncbi:MAG: hypothetical protein JNK82_12060 [Myxococcaceae bacterium]|nr:hypothetical protein [Myxococcaceae bacterium]
MLNHATPLELRAYGDDEECAAAFQWCFANHVDVVYPRIRVIGAPRFVHDALDVWDRTPHARLSLAACLDEALARQTLQH